jgi:predicted nuclease of restriction endonuclease-like RecB superfamily
LLTADLVRVYRRGTRLYLRALDRPAREAGAALAERFLTVIRSHPGQCREELELLLKGLSAAASAEQPKLDRRLVAGLLKLVLDRCEFDAAEDSDPTHLRRELFRRASAARRGVAALRQFDRQALVAEFARERGITGEQVDELLYADLRGAHRLRSFFSTSGSALVAEYLTAQEQAILLRATRIRVVLHCASPAVLRSLFQQLKFHRLLFELRAREEDQYELTIDGPFGLFRASTRYGLKLGLLLPLLAQADRFQLEAELIWGHERRSLIYRTEGGRPSEAERTGAPALREDVADLLERFREHGGTYRAQPSTAIINLPGVGLCIPDLVFVHERTGAQAYLEVLGFWSREAVWRRVSLAQAGLAVPILFAVSERLRVSEQALGPDSTAALYVYKGMMRPAMIEERLAQLTRAWGKSAAAPSSRLDSPSREA